MRYTLNQILNCMIIFLMLFLFSSCIKKNDYPAHWGELQKVGVEDCPNLNGIYKNKSANFNSSGYNVYLTQAFGKKNMQTAYVEIIQINNQLIHVQGFSHDMRLIFGNTYRADNSDFKCELGMVNFKLPSESTSSEASLEFSWGRSFYFNKTADGWLAMKAERSYAGTLMLAIPYGGQSSEWFLFGPKTLD